MKLFRSTVKQWLPLAVAITLLCAVIYIPIQQVYRMNANDPQIQVAEDTARALEAGKSPQTVIPSQPVELSQSLGMVVMVFSTDGKLLATNASLHGNAPVLPAGVLDEARKTGENRVTWQPESGVRSAIVIVSVKGVPGGYVVAGRSLREVELRVDSLTQMILLGWVGTLFATLLAVIVLELLPFTRTKE